MDASSDVDDEEQLRLAIALSLQDQIQNRQAIESLIQPTFLDLLADNGLPDMPDPDKKNSEQSNTEHKDAFKLSGLDRSTMEAERLARNLKRKASKSPRSSARYDKLSKDTGLSPSKERMQMSSSVQTPQTGQNGSIPHGGLQYPKGIVKRTWSFGFPRDNDIKLEEVLQRSTLQLAVLSSFQWEIDWLFAKIDMLRSRVVLVMQANDEDTREQYKRETASEKNLRLCFPPMPDNVNCMHSKLMLLSHPGYLRVVVPTGNLTKYDWGENGIIENSLFLIDLPRLPPSSPPQEESKLTFFGQELLRYCRAMCLSADISRSLLRFDFSATKPYAFVHSIGGEHVGIDEPWRYTGYPGLGRAVKHLGLQTNAPLEIDFVCSSIGALNLELLSTLYLAAQGDDGRKELSWRSRGKSKKSQTETELLEGSSQTSLKRQLQEQFRVFFPSRNTVLKSKGGLNAAGPICFRRYWWEKPSFPRQVMRDFNSTRSGLLIHSKILFVRTQDRDRGEKEETPDSDATTVDEDMDVENRYWAYIGSANCTEYAWGKMTMDRTRKIPKLICKNWECGVLVVVEPSKINKDDHQKKANDLTNFSGTVPVPMEWPGEPMDGKVPWFFTED